MELDPKFLTNYKLPRQPAFNLKTVLTHQFLWATILTKKLAFAIFLLQQNSKRKSSLKKIKKKLEQKGRQNHLIKSDSEILKPLIVYTFSLSHNSKRKK